MRYFRARIHFWIDQALILVVTIASIWFASRIGYREALRFARYEEIRKSRNLMRAMENEMNVNERQLRIALEDWDSHGFRDYQPVTSSFERAKGSDEFFLVHPDTWVAMSDAYGPSFQNVIDLLRKSGTGEIVQIVARWFWAHVEKFEKARPLLERDIATVEARMREFGIEDVSIAKEWPPLPKAEPSPAERRAMDLPTSEGWTRSGPEAYGGTTLDFSFEFFAVPARPRGPNLIQISTSFSGNRRATRLWVCLSSACPIPAGASYRVGQDAADLFAMYSGRGDVILTIPLNIEPVNGYTKVELSLVDPGAPAGWRWMYLMVEDDTGERQVIRHPGMRKISGEDNPRKFDAVVPEGALVLPRGYLRDRPVPPSVTAPEFFSRGMEHLAGKRYAQAVYNLTACLRLDPKHADVRRFRGQALAAMGDLGGAIDDFSAAISAHPTAELHFLRAEARLERSGKGYPGDVEKALPDYDAVLKLDPDHQAARRGRALIRMRLRDYDGALADFRALGDAERVRRCERFAEDAAHRADGPRNDSEAQDWFKKALDAHFDRRLDEAIDIFKRIFYADPNSDHGRGASINIACGYALKGDADRCVDWIGIALDHGFEDWVLILADADFESVRGHERYRALTAAKAVELAPQVRRARRRAEDQAIADAEGPQDLTAADQIYAHAVAALQAKSYPAAINGFKMLYYHPPTQNLMIKSAYNLACAYALSADRDRALDWLEIAIADGYDDFEHIKGDADLESLRMEPRYKEMVAGN